MKPIAQRDEEARVVLVEVAPGRGRVLDRDEGVLYPAMRLDSILARGYWEPFGGDVAAVVAEAKRAREAGGGPRASGPGGA